MFNNPRLISISRVFTYRSNTTSRSISFYAVLTSLSLILLGLFLCSWRGTTELYRRLPSAIIPPELVISGIFSFGGALLVVSNVVVCLNIFFFSHDLERILGSPRRISLIIGDRFLETLIFASWMPFLLFCTVLFGLGLGAKLNLMFFVTIIPVIILFLLIPTASILILVTFLLLFVSKISLRYIYAIVAAILLGIFYGLTNVIAYTTFKIDSFDNIFKSFKTFSFYESWWSIPALVAKALVSPGTTSPDLEKLANLLIISSSSTLISICILTYLYRPAYEAARSIFYFRKNTRERVSLLAFILFGRENNKIGYPERAVIFKEILTLYREPSHLLQMIIVLSLWGVYIYNLQFLASANSSLFFSRQIWLFVSLSIHIILSQCVCIAFVNRFVYPSVSLESHAFWVIQSSSLSFEKYLKAKFILWSCIVASLNALSVGFGASFLTSWAPLIFLCSILGALLGVVFVILGLVLGTKFAVFSWEHIPEITASPGSVFFFFSAISWLILAGATIILSLYAIIVTSYSFFMVSLALILLNSIALLILFYSLINKKLTSLF